MKSIVLICLIVLFVPALVFGDSIAARGPSSTYKQQIQARFNLVAQEKEFLEQALIAMSGLEYENESDSELDKCQLCKKGMNALVATFGCGSFLISYKSCLPFCSTVVGGLACGALVFSAKHTIVKACERYTSISKVQNYVSNIICKEKTHLC